MPLRPEVLPPTSDSFPRSTGQKEDQHHVFLHPPLLHQILVHVSSLTGAASKMYQDLTTFKRVSKAVSDACLPVLQKHTWYLTEECIPIALSNPALEIGGLPPTSIQIRKPTLPSITSSGTLPDFVGPRSFLLFSQLKLNHTFLLAED